MSDGIVQAVLCGRAEERPAQGTGEQLDRPWYTAYYKTPVDGPVAVRFEGLEGDEQADTLRHGGAEKAILAYAAEHYPRWQSELGIDRMPAGGFGENLLVEGQSEASVCLGDIYRCGTALLQVLQPRQPGWKVARRWDRIGLPKKVGATRRTGWYQRVLEEGTLRAGDPLVLEERLHPEWTVQRAIEVLYSSDRDPRPARELAACPALGESWKIKLAARFKISY